MAEAVGSESGAPQRISASREFAPTAVGFLLVLSCVNVGFMLVLLIPFLLVWFVRMAWIAWRQPDRRRAQAIKLGVIVSTICIVLVVQGYYQRQARAEAQKVVDAVAAYRLQHGAYPADLAQLGLDAQALRRRWRIRYDSTEGEHSVMYAATFTVFDSYSYELEHPGWVFHAD